MVFDDEDELEDWLAELDYEAFWKAIVCLPELELEDRAAFDALIADGHGTEAEILQSLKIIAQITIAEARDLLPRIIEPHGPSMRIH
jgi:uncharacterized protein (DUF608 family)